MKAKIIEKIKTLCMVLIIGGALAFIYGILTGTFCYNDTIEIIKNVILVFLAGGMTLVTLMIIVVILITIISEIIKRLIK